MARFIVFIGLLLECLNLLLSVSAKERARWRHEDKRFDTCFVRRSERVMSWKQSCLRHPEQGFSEPWMAMRHHATAEIGRTSRRYVMVRVFMRGAVSVGCGEMMLARMRVLVVGSAHGGPGKRNRQRQQQAGQDIAELGHEIRARHSHRPKVPPV
jgi:hypothetical protein